MKSGLAIKRMLGKMKTELFRVNKKLITPGDAEEHEHLRTVQQCLCWSLGENVMNPHNYYLKFHKQGKKKWK